MSLYTWQKEFLKKTDLEKWVGFRPENLKKHGVSLILNPGWREPLGAFRVTDGRWCFPIDGGSCELCRNHIKKVGFCDECPIYCVSDEHPHPCANNDSLFGIAESEGNIEPMIALLHQVKNKLPERDKSVNIFSREK